MKICVYCGSTPGDRTAYADVATRLGRRLVERGHSLVYGGGRVGLMGAVADAVLGAGGEVDGVIPRSLVDREIAHCGVTRLHVVESMSERKTLMAELADAFVALPGGIGTLEELFETWTAGALGHHTKAVSLLDVDGFFAPLRSVVRTAVEHGFLAGATADGLIVQTEPDALLDALVGYVAPPSRWAAAPAGTTEPAEALDVLAWVVVREGRLLQARTRGQDLFYAPGGKREPGESDVAALCREVSEELGVALDPTSLTLVTVITAAAVGAAAGRTVRMACYAADPQKRSPPPRPCGEIAEIAWLTTADRSRCAPADQILMDQLSGRGLMD